MWVININKAYTGLLLEQNLIEQWYTSVYPVICYATPNGVVNHNERTQKLLLYKLNLPSCSLLQLVPTKGDHLYIFRSNKENAYIA